MDAEKRSPQLRRPWSLRAPDGPWDYVVVGSGVGGMTTAAILSDIGRRVLVVEQHYVPGGYTHMFKRKGYEWDVGVHAVGEASDDFLAGQLLRQLTRGKLRWASLGEIYDEYHWPDGRLDIPRTQEHLREHLLQVAPNESKAIDAYFALARDVSNGMSGHFLARALPRPVIGIADRLLARNARRHRSLTTAHVVSQLTDNERLRAALTAQWGYYGSDPSRSSYAVHAMVVRHFLRGAFYPVGGSKQIARHMLQTVADNGGWTRIRCDVDEILIEGGRAAGVRLADGEIIRAKRVVCGVGIGATVRNLLPEQERRNAWVREVEQLPSTPAHVCLYLGFKGDIRQAGGTSANKWFYDSRRNEAYWNVEPDTDLGRAPLLYCSFPSLKDPSHEPGPEQRHTGEALAFVRWETFARWRDAAWRRRGIDYDSFKQQLQAKLLEQLFEKLPGLRAMLDHVEMSTPVSTDKFCRPVAGAIYGLEPTVARFQSRWLVPRSPIRDMYFTGSDIAVGGVVGAMMGGAFAALAAEPLRAGKYLRPYV